MIRHARLEDVEVVASLEQRNLGVDAWSADLVAQGVTGTLPTIRYLVAEADGQIVGHAVASIVADIAELQRIAVDPAHRRTGLATALLDAVVDEARTEDADRLLIEVREDNDGALAFYATRGFVEIDRRQRYYRDGTTAIVMRLPLREGCGGAGVSP